MFSLWFIFKNEYHPSENHFLVNPINKLSSDNVDNENNDMAKAFYIFCKYRL